MVIISKMKGLETMGSAAFYALQMRMLMGVRELDDKLGEDVAL